MKKYIILGSVFLVSAILIVGRIYKNTPIVSAVVESVESGVKSVAVAVGIKAPEPKKKIELNLDEDLEGDLGELSDLYTLEDDSLSLDALALEDMEEEEVETVPYETAAKKLEKEIEAKRLAEEARKKKEDSLALIAANTPEKKTVNKENPFNVKINKTAKVVEEPKTGFNVQTRTVSNRDRKYFSAKIHGSQELMDNSPVKFRTNQNLIIGGELIPKNFVFYAKANIFNDRVIFHVEEIAQVKVESQNFDDQRNEGIPLSTLPSKGEKYFVSDGDLLTFNY